jgi:hypothetical protein
VKTSLRLQWRIAQTVPIAHKCAAFEKKIQLFQAILQAVSTCPNHIGAQPCAANLVNSLKTCVRVAGISVQPKEVASAVSINSKVCRDALAAEM